MTNEGFFHRQRSGGYKTVIKGLDFYVALLATASVYFLIQHDIEQLNPITLIENITFFSQSIVAIIIVGVSILVTITNIEFLKVLVEEGGMDKLLNTFEITAMLALLTAAVGVIIQSIGYTILTFYIMLFLGLYLLFAVARLISVIVSFGRRRAMLAVIADLPDDLYEKLEVQDNVEEDNLDEH